MIMSIPLIDDKDANYFRYGHLAIILYPKRVCDILWK